MLQIMLVLYLVVLLPLLALTLGHYVKTQFAAGDEMPVVEFEAPGVRCFSFGGQFSCIPMVAPIYRDPDEPTAMAWGLL
ncbi:hypothetical protein BRI6_1093 [plant metagenome]|uniref:Uncharacterized protein n=1 Tax=plant metagenome TaxID=1297885 RepID=A0A484RWS7_9ZZZZ